MLAALLKRFAIQGKGEPETVQPKPKPYYQLGKQIGKGSFSEVRMISPKTTKDDQQKMAVKIIQKSENSSTNKVIVREVKALKKLIHPNIIGFHEVLRKDDKFYIVMDYAEGGDLFQRLDKHGALSESEAKVIFSGIISALGYCHSLNIAHRDLKLENVLLDLHNTPKISDFGFSRSCMDRQGKRILSNTYCGSLYYASPEILMGTPYNPTLADVWSAGVILYAMVFNAMPFMEKEIKLLVRKQMNREMSLNPAVNLSGDCVAIIKWMLEADLLHRVTTNRLINSQAWLTWTEVVNTTQNAV